jgi:starch phosphorylase
MSQAEASSIHSEQMIDLLRELALDLGAVWNRYTDDIWRQIDPDVWLLTRNPWLMLHHASQNKLKSMANDQDLRSRVEQLVLARRESSYSPAWFQKTHSGSAVSRVAYFSMEFGLSEALPIYSGGLGNVAGDQLKAGSDLGVPIHYWACTCRRSSERTPSRSGRRARSGDRFMQLLFRAAM